MMRRVKTVGSASDLALYTHAAQLSSARIIHEYSTSFLLASRLLAPKIRADIESIYALVRIADEIVDGAADQAGLDAEAQRGILDHLEAETERAIMEGYSSNPVVHSFAVTARRTGIDHNLLLPFFASMRRDLGSSAFSASELSDYIYGSAEVVGLMCLRAFIADTPVADGERHRLEAGARHLGAAFQKVNFLRDLGADWGELGRSYFPGVDPQNPTEPEKLALVSEIDADLAEAASVIPDLPRTCRRAVIAAYALFAELNDRIRITPAAELARRRIRVPNTAKLAILVRATAFGQTGARR
jgi:15-cis-phytoene synthase